MLISCYKNIKKQFEKSMKEYDKNAVVQKMMADKLLIELSKVNKKYKNVLELGVGTGILTHKLTDVITFEKFFANDIVDKSKLYVQKIIPDAVFMCGNALKIRPAKKMDLIISNAMFQWFNDLEKAIVVLSLTINKGGILAFSTFGPDNYSEVKNITGLSLNYKTVEEIKNILISQGYKIHYIESFYEELMFNSPLELLAHMKNTGVNSLSETSWGIKNVKVFCENFLKTYKTVKLTYAPIIVIAEKL